MQPKNDDTAVKQRKTPSRTKKITNFASVLRCIGNTTRTEEIKEPSGINTNQVSESSASILEPAMAETAAGKSKRVIIRPGRERAFAGLLGEDGAALGSIP